MKSRYFIISLVLVLSLVVGGIIFFGRDATPRIKFFDGSRISVGGFTRGTNHQFTPGGTWNNLKKKILPTNGLSIGKLKLMPPQSLPIQTGENYTILWLRHEGKAPPVAGAMTWMAEIIDESGHSLSLVTGSAWNFFAAPGLGG